MFAASPSVGSIERFDPVMKLVDGADLLSDPETFDFGRLSRTLSNRSPIRGGNTGSLKAPINLNSAGLIHRSATDVVKDAPKLRHRLALSSVVRATALGA